MIKGNNNEPKFKSINKEKILGKNLAEKIEMNLSYPIKNKKSSCKKDLNLLESYSLKNNLITSPMKANSSNNKIISTPLINSEKNKKIIYKIIKKQIKNIDNKTNTSPKKINDLNDNKKEIKNEIKNIKEKILENNTIHNKNEISSSLNNYSNNCNNLNLIYSNDQYNNDLFSNLFIDNSSENKNILVSELDIELSNTEQSNYGKKNEKEKQNKNIIEDEEDTNQKSNEQINVYKKIELRFKSKLEKSLNKYFQKNGANYYIGDSNKILNNNKNKSNSNKDEKNNKKEKNNIKNLINSDRKINNVNFTKDLKEKNKKQININSNNNIRFIKTKLEENEIKKFKKIATSKASKFKMNNNIKNNNLITKNELKDTIKKESSTKNKPTKKAKYFSSNSKIIICKKFKNSIHSKILDKTNIINKKNNSTGVRQVYKLCPFYLHSINSIKTKKNNTNIYSGFNKLFHNKMKNNLFKGELTVTSFNSNAQGKNYEEINNQNNISYYNSKSAKNKNKLNKFFSFILNENNNKNCTYRPTNSIINNSINFRYKNKEFYKKGLKSSYCKTRTKPLFYYKEINTEFINFNNNNNFDKINKKLMLSNMKTNKEINLDESVQKRNIKNKVKSDVFNVDLKENSAFIYNKDLFVYNSPYKNRNVLKK